MIDLRAKDKQALEEIAEQTLPSNAEIWAYGSRVQGTNHEASDLDLVIRTPDEQPLSAEALEAFIAAVQDSTIPILVQVFDWERLPAAFHANILSRHEVFWAGCGDD